MQSFTNHTTNQPKKDTKDAMSFFVEAFDLPAKKRVN